MTYNALFETYHIAEGDTLAVNGTDFKVRRAAFYEYGRLSTKGSFSKMASVDCSIKRAGATVDSEDSNLYKRGSAPGEVISDLRCLPLDPIRPKLAESEGFTRIYNIRETFLPASKGYWHLWVETNL